MLPHADAMLRRGEWQDTVPHGKGEAEGKSDATGMDGGWGCALALAFLGCQRDSAEQRLRKDIAAMQAAVEEHRLRDAMASVAEDFAGEAGMDRAALHNLLRAQSGPASPARIFARLPPATCGTEQPSP